MYSSEKGILNRANFQWNANSFCETFCHTKNANEFDEVWQDATEFDKVLEHAKVLVDSSAESQVAVDVGECCSDKYRPLTQDTPLPSSSQQSTCTRKRSLADACDGSGKKPRARADDVERSAFDEAIERKRVGKSMCLRCYVGCSHGACQCMVK